MSYLIYEFQELVNALYHLGHELPQYLIVLSEFAEPNLTPDQRVTVLARIFEDVPNLLRDVSPNAFNTLMATLPHDAVTLRMLLNIHSYTKLFQQISYPQLLQLTNNVIPPGPLTMQLEVLLIAQSHVCAWHSETAAQLHDELTKATFGQERRRFLELQPSIPWNLLQMFVEMLTLPKHECLDFFAWFSKLNREDVHRLVQILQLEPVVVLEYKNRLTRFSFVPNTWTTTATQEISEGTLFPCLNDAPLDINSLENLMLEPLVDIDTMNMYNEPLIDSNLLQISPLPVSPPNPPASSSIPLASFPISSPTVTIPPHAGALVTTGIITTTAPPSLAVAPLATFDFTLRINGQPPSRVVYHTIIKPFPSVMVCGPGVHTAALNNLFVEASLVRSESDDDMSIYLDGNRVERIANGVMGIFKKLKLLSTTLQQRTLFRLKFVLKRHTGNSFQSIPGSVVYSDLIDVVSHKSYIRTDEASVKEVLPSSGVVGTKVVILGDNFLNTNKLRVRFGEVEATSFRYHEKTTIICNIPNIGTNKPVPVQVSNDGECFCESRVFFVYG